MSDNLRQYRAIRDALIQGYPGEPQGRCARHLVTLAALISGIVASKSTHLPKIAGKVPDGTKAESRVKRFARWVDNARITAEGYFVPYAELLLVHLALRTLVLVIDGSVVGRGCVALMIHVVYKGRALPLAWVVRRGKKGYFPEALHMVVYPSPADNFIVPQTRYNAPSHHTGEGARSWFHTFFTINSLCWPSCGSSSCCMLPSLAEGLRYHRQRRPSNPSAHAPTSPNRLQA